MTTQANNQSALTKKGADSTASTPVERFTNKVLEQFSATAGELNVTEKQRRLIRNYFLTLDFVLQTSEKKRNPEKNSVPFTWENVDLKRLSIDVANHSMIGLDPIQKNHLSLIPNLDGRSRKYVIDFRLMYKGIEFKAKKYGLDIPKAVIVEVVYKNDVFKPKKKNGGGVGDSYEFEIVEPFNRGEVVGGFYFHEFEDPSNNKIRIFSIADIKKRIPSYASPDFWGGERNGKKVEGWFDEMCYKTIYRAAYDSITIDPDKIDEVLIQTMFAEQQALEAPSRTEDVVHEEINSAPIFITQTEEGFTANGKELPTNEETIFVNFEKDLESVPVHKIEAEETGQIYSDLFANGSKHSAIKNVGKANFEKEIDSKKAKAETKDPFDE